MLLGLGFKCLSSTRLITIWFVVVSVVAFVVDLYFSKNSCKTSKLFSKYPKICCCCFGTTNVFSSTTIVGNISVVGFVVASVVVYLIYLKLKLL